MKLERWQFVAAAMVMAAVPALAQTVGTGSAPIPDFSGIWWHPSLPVNFYYNS